ncbi:MAG: sigma factor-like helix-turn-helix DNA-binding protein [Culicoidibacterales bacterium]
MIINNYFEAIKIAKNTEMVKIELYFYFYQALKTGELLEQTIDRIQLNYKNKINKLTCQREFKGFINKFYQEEYLYYFSKKRIILKSALCTNEQKREYQEMDFREAQELLKRRLKTDWINVLNFEFFLIESDELGDDPFILECYNIYKKLIRTSQNRDLNLESVMLSFGISLKEVISEFEGEKLNFSDFEARISSNKNYSEGLIILYKYVNFNFRNELESIITGRDLKRNFYIIDKRSKGYTLGEIGDSKKLTRERVRQIESKSLERFKKIIESDTVNILDILVAKNKTNYLFTYKELTSFFEKYTDIFIYFYQLLEEKKGFIYPKQGILNLSDFDWAQAISEYEPVGSSCRAQEITLIIEEIQKNFLEQKNIHLEKDLIADVLMVNFKKRGEIYSREMVSLRKVYQQILSESEFSNGIHISNQEELDLMKKIAKERFLINIDYQSIRAMQAIIMHVGILVGRGRYSVTQEHRSLKIPQDLSDKMIAYIKKMKPVIAYASIFNTFKTELATYGIHNRFNFKVIFDPQIADVFYVSRDYVSTIADYFSMEDMIEVYVLSKKRFVSVKEICEHFDGISEVMVTANISNTTYIREYAYKLLHPANIGLTKEDIRTLEKTLQQVATENNVVNSEELYSEIEPRIRAELQKIGICSGYGLVSIIGYVFDNKYTFKRPFILESYTQKIIEKEQLATYMTDKKDVLLEEIYGFIKQKKIILLSMNGFIDAISYSHLRMEFGRLIRVTEIELSDQQQEKIRKTLNNYLQDDERLLASEEKIYTMLPRIAYEWNKYSLSAIIKYYLKEFTVIGTSHMYNNTDFIIQK